MAIELALREQPGQQLECGVSQRRGLVAAVLDQLVEFAGGDHPGSDPRRLDSQQLATINQLGRKRVDFGVIG